jgi:hypothetical protein
MDIDWSKLEEIIERIIRRTRSEEFRDVAEALKALADYMRTGFQEVSKRLEEMNKILEKHSKVLEEHGKILETHGKILEAQGKVLEEHGKILGDLSRAVGELKVAIGSLGRRWGRDLERAVLEIYRHVLEERGIEPGKVEKFVYTDVDGRYYRQGSRLEVDVYIHDDKAYLLEIKSHAELDDVEWFFDKARIVEKILSRRTEKVIIVTVNIDKDALERARELGIDVVYGAVIE